MNHAVYVNGVQQHWADYRVTYDGELELDIAPSAGAQIVIQASGQTQGFSGTGYTTKFSLSSGMQNLVQENQGVVKYQKILYAAMQHLDNDAVKFEITRLATVVAMVKDYDSNT